MPIVLVETDREESTNRESVSSAVPSSEFVMFTISPGEARQWSPARFMHFATLLGIPGQRLRNEYLRNVGELVSQHMSTLPEVMRAIGNVEEDDTISICTVIDSQDRKARYRVYEVERKILTTLTQFTFDFRVINLRNYTGATLAGISKVEGEILYDRLSTISNDEPALDFNNLPEEVSYAFAR